MAPFCSEVAWISWRHLIAHHKRGLVGINLLMADIGHSRLLCQIRYQRFHYSNTSTTTSSTSPLMIDSLLSTAEFLWATLARVGPERLPTLPLLVLLCSLRFLFLHKFLLLYIRRSNPELRLSHEAVLASKVLQTELSMPVKLVPLAVPLVAGAADEGAGELLAQRLPCRRVRLSHER